MSRFFLNLVIISTLVVAPAFAEQVASPDGKLTAKVVTTDGDWRRIDIADTRTGAVRERLEGAAYTEIAWAPDGSGIWYSRMPPLPTGFPVSGPTTAPRGFHEVDFHRLGKPQSEDELIYSTDRFNMFHTAQVTADGRWIVITSSLEHKPLNEIVLIKRDQVATAPWKLIRTLNNAWSFAGSKGDQFYFVTDLEAPRGRLVAIDINATKFLVREVVAQGPYTLTAATLKSNGIVLTYSQGTKLIPLEVAQ